MWIVKPANSSQGKGIYLIDDVNDVNVDDLSVVSRYVTNPLLINGHKFDLRVYVLVTSYEPLRVYVFKEGLARFASETYTTKINKDNRLMHLTNYSLNKKSEKFIQNENADQDDFGFKWSLGAFCKHLEQVGIDMALLWSRCYDLILKTLLCGESHVTNAMKKNGCHRTNCFELLGYDILLDSDLKPWLLEVNLSSSMATDSPLDWNIKSNCMTDALNCAGIKRFDRKKESMNKMKYRMKGMYGNRPQNNLNSQKKFGSGVFGVGIQGNTYNNVPNTTADLQQTQVSPQMVALIEKFIQDNQMEFGHLTDSLKKASIFKYKDIIAETLAENARKGNFVRIYPAKNSDMYDGFFSTPIPLNKLLYRVLYTEDILKIPKYGSIGASLKDPTKPPRRPVEEESKEQNPRQIVSAQP